MRKRESGPKLGPVSRSSGAVHHDLGSRSACGGQRSHRIRLASRPSHGSHAGHRSFNRRVQQCMACIRCEARRQAGPSGVKISVSRAADRQAQAQAQAQAHEVREAEQSRSGARRRPSYGNGAHPVGTTSRRSRSGLGRRKGGFIWVQVTVTRYPEEETAKWQK